MLESMIIGWLIGAAIGAAIFFTVKPSASAAGASRWGRNTAAWIGFWYSVIFIHRAISQGLVNGGAAFLVQIIVALGIGYLLGAAAYWIFRGTKKAKEATPGVLHAVTEKTSGLTAHMRDSMNPYDSSDADSYAKVSAEMKTAPLDEGLWTKAIAMADGNEAAAKARYIKLRVNQLKLPTSAKEEQSLPHTMQPQSFSSPDMTDSIPMSLQIDEAAIYTAVADELDTGKIDKGLWVRLYAEFDGDEKKTKVAYIKQRAERLVALEQGRLEEIKGQRDLEAARLEEIVEKIALVGSTLREQLSATNITVELAEKLRTLSDTHSAVKFLDKVRRNLLYDVEVDIADNPFIIAVTDSDGNSSLHVAIEEKHIKMVQLLLEKGAPIDINNLNGDTPLNLSRKTGSRELIVLMEAVSAIQSLGQEKELAPDPVTVPSAATSIAYVPQLQSEKQQNNEFAALTLMAIALCLTVLIVAVLMQMK